MGLLGLGGPLELRVEAWRKRPGTPGANALLRLQWKLFFALMEKGIFYLNIFGLLSSRND